MYCTLPFRCVQVQTLPTAQATPALTDSFSRGHDHYTHACEARPLTTVGWTSSSVIVIVSSKGHPFLKPHDLFVEGGVANPRREKDTRGTSPTRPERVASARLLRTRTNDTPEEQASGQREPRTNPQRKRWRRAIRLLIMTGACGSAAMLADPDTLPTLRASAAQPYYVATITSVIHDCTGGLRIEERGCAGHGLHCTKYTLRNVEGSKLASGCYEDTKDVPSRVPAKKEKKASCGLTMDEVDVWVVLHGRVFNVPNFLSQRPGGESAILTPAGKDATAQFDMIHPPDVVKKCAPKCRHRHTLGRRRGTMTMSRMIPQRERTTMEDVAKHNKKGDVWVVFEWSFLERFKFPLSATLRRVDHIDFCREGCHRQVRHDAPA